MAKNIHASVRLGHELYEPLRLEAEEKYEGNISLLIRMILREWVKGRSGVKIV